MPEWIMQLAGYFVAGGMAYGAIRSDLAALHEKASMALRNSEKANDRIRDHIDRHHTK